MNPTISLDFQINRLGFWSAIVVLATGIVSLFLPLDAPGGFSAEHTDRVAWLSANSGAFILAWINQIVAMLTLSGVLFAMAWQIANKNPLRAIVAAMVVLLSVVAFIIPKFIAIWTIPQLAETISTGTMGAELADPLLRLLNVSIPFSLYTSFDYLGFWLYALFGFLVAGPLYGEKTSLKIAAVSLGLFSLGYHCMLVGVLLDAIAPAGIETWSLSISVLLLIPVVAMVFSFRSAMRTNL